MNKQLDTYELNQTAKILCRELEAHNQEYHAKMLVLLGKLDKDEDLGLEGLEDLLKEREKKKTEDHEWIEGWKLRVASSNASDEWRQRVSMAYGEEGKNLFPDAYNRVLVYDTVLTAMSKTLQNLREGKNPVSVEERTWNWKRRGNKLSVEFHDRKNE